MPEHTTRRDLLALGTGAFVLAVLPSSGRHPRRRHRRRVPLMGTSAEVLVVAGDRARARDATNAALAALRDVDRLMSRFRPDSDVGRANRRAAREAVRVAPATAHVLERALAWARRSAGRFDPCLGRAGMLWDVGRRTSPPPAARVGALAGRGLWQALDLDLDARGGAIRYRDPDVALDLGGIAKGYGVDRAADALRAHGIRDGVVNVGGDLVVLGCSERDTPWRVGVRDGRDPRRIERVLELSDRAVATSGDYQRYFDHAGRRYHHLIDPATGAPRVASRHSVTVTAATCIEADAAATAAFA